MRVLHCATGDLSGVVNTGPFTQHRQGTQNDPLHSASPQTYIVFIVVALDLLLGVFQLRSDPKGEAKTLRPDGVSEQNL